MDSQGAYPGRGLPTAMLLAVALGACSNAKTPAPAPQVPEVSVTTVHRGSVPITTELPGRTSAYLVAQVRARVDGIVLKREFKEGSEVKLRWLAAVLVIGTIALLGWMVMIIEIRVRTLN